MLTSQIPEFAFTVAEKLITAIIPILIAGITRLFAQFFVDVDFTRNRRSLLYLPLYSIISKNISITASTAQTVMEQLISIVYSPSALPFASSGLLDLVNLIDKTDATGKYNFYNIFCESITLDLMKDERKLRIPRNRFPGAASHFSSQRISLILSVVLYIVGAIIFTDAENRTWQIWLCSIALEFFAIICFSMSYGWYTKGKKWCKYAKSIIAPATRKAHHHKWAIQSAKQPQR